MKKAGALAVLCVAMLVMCGRHAYAEQEHHDLTIAPEVPGYSSLSISGPRGDIMRAARKYRGTRYDRYSWNCSDYTRQVFGEAVGVWMRDWDDKQIRYGHRPAHRKRGDLVFFDENGRNDRDGPVTHVAIFAGSKDGIPYVWHSSSYYGEVVKSPLTWITANDGSQAYVPRYTRRIR